MRLLLTGAFGNIGSATVEELLQRGHAVRCFDLRTKANERAARRLGPSVEVVWGDLRREGDVAQAVEDQEAVVHLAFVIPKLSATGRSSEVDPAWSRSINVGGTQNLISALAAQPRPARLVFVSSLHVYGLTQNLPPPRTVQEVPHPVEHYARHKLECERLVEGSGLTWAILRLGAAPPTRLILDRGMFEVPLDNRIEFVHRRDVALAIANALESSEVWGRIWLIGGGPRCQVYQRDLVAPVLEAIGVGMLPDSAFTTAPFATEWLDTAESQRVLDFQRRTLDDYVRDVLAAIGPRRHLIRLFRPSIRAWMLCLAQIRKWKLGWRAAVA